ncbi:Uncharacterised protein [Dorea longicatena]|nr:Uncharacterised protein [Dorea longicatena]
MKHAMRYYNLQDNPCRKAGAIGKSKGEPKDFWMQEEFNAFLETVSDKPETRIACVIGKNSIGFVQNLSTVQNFSMEC